MKGLVDIEELYGLLGYTDDRSVLAWLRKVNAPLVGLGRKTYTTKKFIENHIANAMGSNNASLNASGGNRSIQSTGLNDAAIAVNNISKRRERRRLKNNNSEAATTLLKNIASAK